MSAALDYRHRWPLVFAGLGVLVFGVLAWAVLSSWQPMATGDQQIADHFAEVAASSKGWVAFWQVIALVLHPTVFIVVELGAALVVLVRMHDHRRKRHLVTLLVLTAAGGLVSTLAKVLVQRPRPDGAAVEAMGWSFPSGHAFGAAAAVVTAVVLAWPRMSTGMRGWVVAAATASAVLVAFDRLALDVHYLSDVLAGLSLGMAWALLAAFVTGHPRRSSPLGPGDPSSLA